jgi:calmodulin
MGNRISSAVSVTSKLKRRDNGSVIDMLTEAQLDEFREAFNSFDKVCAGCGLLLSTSHWEEMTLAVRAHAKERGLRLACVRALDVISFGRLAHTPRALAQNGGGSIDARELKELMVSAGQNPTDEELEEMIRIADADGTGDIDFAEFVTLMAHRIADEKSEETLRAAFSVFDTSGDGFINAEEMRRIMMHMGEPVTLDDVDQVIRKVDRDGDGVIDYNEFTKVTCLLAAPQAQASSRRRESLELLHAPALLLSAGATLPTSSSRAAVLASQVIMDEFVSSKTSERSERK